jgi:hypothetical protein
MTEHKDSKESPALGCKDSKAPLDSRVIRAYRVKGRKAAKAQLAQLVQQVRASKDQ